jgi:hypothetical protein
MGNGKTGFYEASDVIEGVEADASEDVGQHGGFVHVKL